MKDKAQLAVFTPYGRAGASSRVRVFDWLDWLHIDAYTHSYTGSPSNRPSSLLRHPGQLLRAELAVRRAAVISLPLLLSREATPFSRGEVEARLLRASPHGAYDLDDALFSDKGSGIRRLFSKSVKCRAAAESADTVIAGSAVIADWASAHNHNVVLVPSCVDPGKFTAKSEWSINDEPRIVWLGSPSTERYLVAITAPLLEMRRRLRARLIVISAGSATLGPLDPMTTRIPWSEDMVGEALATADVAVAPLTNTPYARGKCAYKVLQYAAAGLPIIGSPVGANALALDRLGGMSAHNQSEWVDALLHTLTAGESHREKMSAAAISGVAKHYAFRAWEGRWLEAVGIDPGALVRHRKEERNDGGLSF